MKIIPGPRPRFYHFWIRTAVYTQRLRNFKIKEVTSQKEVKRWIQFACNTLFQKWASVFELELIITFVVATSCCNKYNSQKESFDFSFSFLRFMLRKKYLIKLNYSRIYNVFVCTKGLFLLFLGEHHITSVL